MRIIFTEITLILFSFQIFIKSDKLKKNIYQVRIFLRNRIKIEKFNNTVIKMILFTLKTENRYQE